MHLNQAISALLAFLAVPSSAFFRLPCRAPLVVQRADPIVNPGSLAGHVHTIMGGNGFGFEMDYNSTQVSTCSSCVVAQDKSNYWVPTLYYKAKNGTFTSVEQNGGMTVYYLQRQDPQDPGFSEGLHAFPPGFTILAGDNTLRSFSDTPEQNAISYACLGSNTKETKGFPDIKCPGGIRAQVFFPSCWDGVNFEPKDQKKHLAYPSGVDSGHCSAPFNKRLVSLFYEVIWKTPNFDDQWYDDTQPFIWSNGDPTGYGYHGDFINGWDIPVLQKAIDTCTSPSGDIEECSVFDFIPSKEIEGCSIPVTVDEQVTGTLDALPGCNPIQAGPENAILNTGCGAPTHISAPKQEFIDLTASKFEYVGCGLDIAGERRTLLGASTTDQTGMTVERCVDYCRARGFSVAGVEYSSQCYCDNSIPEDRMPSKTASGNCNMKCTGNKEQNCGGAGLISLYRACGGRECKNNIPVFINGSAGLSDELSGPLPNLLSALKSTKKTASGTAAGVNKPPARTKQGAQKANKKEHKHNHQK